MGVECLVKPGNEDVLKKILTYHVASGAAFSADLEQDLEVKTLEGQSLTVDLTDGVKIEGVVVNTTLIDVEASNGVIHAINGVLVPPDVDAGAFLESDACLPLPDIPGTAVAPGIFTTLVAALGAADLVGTLSEPAGPSTVFAPTDTAFENLPEGLVGCLLKAENKDLLTTLLTYHVASGKALSTDLTQGLEVPTLQGQTLTVDLTDGVKIEGIEVGKPNVEASNGVIHIIEGVLVPEDFPTCS